MMEAFHLLYSILSTFLTSVTLSFLIPFRLLLRRITTLSVGEQGTHQNVSLYQGTVWHQRRRPVHHSFSYSVRYAFIDLDHATHAPPDHLSAHEARRYSDTNGSIFLLTIPPSVGYEQNPLSLYYCYDNEGSNPQLKKCIAEVTNTPWGERVLFLFDPNADVVAKPLHVSPFMDMLGNWHIKTNAPGDNLSVSISVQHPKLGDYFTATLKAKKVSSDMNVDHALFFWLMPHKVALWIYWHALKLWWKGVPFIQHPRYSCPLYREEATKRDGKINFGLSEEKSVEVVEESSSDRNVKCHFFTWRDAKWPWC